MKVFQNTTQVHQYADCAEFIKEFNIGEKDFILATKTIYNKYFADKISGAKVFFKSEYGKGEPTDAMVNAMLKDFRATDCERVIAIGGGVSAQGDNLLNPVKECVADRCYGNLKTADLVMAKLGNDAGIVGAAFLGK